MPDLLTCRWWCDASNGGMTAVYAILSDDVLSDRVLIGTFASWELAQSAVGDHNRALIG